MRFFCERIELEFAFSIDLIANARLGQEYQPPPPLAPAPTAPAEEKVQQAGGSGSGSRPGSSGGMSGQMGDFFGCVRGRLGSVVGGRERESASPDKGLIDGEGFRLNFHVRQAREGSFWNGGTIASLADWV